MCCEVSLHYDSNNQVITQIFDTDYSDWLKIDYHWDPQTLTLTRYYPNDSDYRFFYRYDNSRRIEESLDYDLLTSVPYPYHSFFTYNDSGLLIQKDVKVLLDENERFRREGKTGYAFPTHINHQYFYTDGTPDSVVTHYLHVHKPEENYYVRSYYDDSGLKIKKVQSDTLVITYHYTKTP